MAIGKNKRLPKGGKKGKKKIVDPFTKKEWYDVKAPSMFPKRQIGKTLVTRSQGTKLSSDNLKGRVFEVNLADLHNEQYTYKKIKLICEDIQGKNLLTNFHGLDMTRDKLCFIVKKWQTMIEAHVDAKTTDGYTLRLFAIGFTRRHTKQVKKTSYAQKEQVKNIRRKMVEIMVNEVVNSDLKSLVEKLIPDTIGDSILKSTNRIYPLHEVHVRKVKVLSKPKLDLGKLMELHTESVGNAESEDVKGQAVFQTDGYEPPIQESV